MIAYEVFLEWFKESNLELKEENAYEVYDFIRSKSVGSQVVYYNLNKSYIINRYVIKYISQFVAVEICESDYVTWEEMYNELIKESEWFFVEPKATLKFEKI